MCAAVADAFERDFKNWRGQPRDPKLGGDKTAFRDVATVQVGGMDIAVLDRAATADLMIGRAQSHQRGTRPLILSSANGEVLSRCAKQPFVRELFGDADLLNADGQPLVLASRYLCREALPERVATTDLFHDVARRAVETGTTFYMFGASEAENKAATERALQLYPGLKIVGRANGYLSGKELDDKIAEINELGPDILWLALGVPVEQSFCRAFASRLDNVAIIKTSGGLFNFLSGTRSRAPQWMQDACLEWLWRIREEPRRLFWRYMVTNPHAIYLMLSRSH